MKIGQFLIKSGAISSQDLNDALRIQKQQGGKLGQILQAKYGITALQFQQGLAKSLHLGFVNLLEEEVTPELLNYHDARLYIHYQVLPIAYRNHHYVIATADPSGKTRRLIKKLWGKNSVIVVTTKFDIMWTLQKHFQPEYLETIVDQLYLKEPKLSAKKLMARSRKALMSVFFLCLLAWIVFYPRDAFFALNASFTVAIALVLIYKLLLTLTGLVIAKNKPPQNLRLVDKMLPVYTLLVPLFHEKKAIIENLVAAIKRLNYPFYQLDIKIILEQEDVDTIAILKQMRLPSQFELIYVPEGQPQTKAKACNYALQFARGQYVTIYDAEDRPESLQLRHVIHDFEEADDKLACIQCRLNFYNPRENWLARMFTLEYGFWFDLMLPALAHYDQPIPLGGTSNHFRTEVLQALSAWDPYNVTEDADLGIRLYQLGYKTKIIDQTTYEEANTHVTNWIKQRSRWIKGYMQTYIVHMRNPIKLIRKIGFLPFLSFQLFVGGTVVSNLMNIPFWLVFLMFVFAGPALISYLFPTPVYELAVFNFITGSLAMILLNLVAVLRRKLYDMIIYAITAPAYWALMSVASYRALYQLIFKPSHWDKTEHGISAQFVDKTAGKQTKHKR